MYHHRPLKPVHVPQGHTTDAPMVISKRVWTIGAKLLARADESRNHVPSVPILSPYCRLVVGVWFKSIAVKGIASIKLPEQNSNKLLYNQKNLT